MDSYEILKDNIKQTANSIRNKTHSVNELQINEFPQNIDSIEATPEGLYNISVEANLPEVGEVTGGGTASNGMKVTVSAELKNKGDNQYYFENWQENKDGQLLDLTNNEDYSFVVDSSKRLIANFMENTELYWNYKEISMTRSYCTSLACNNNIVIAMEDNSTRDACYLYSEDNGDTWTEIKNKIFDRLDSSYMIYFYKGYFIVPVSDYIIYSQDGKEWQLSEYLPNSPSKDWVFGKDRIIAYTNSTMYDVSIDNGKTWVSYTFPREVGYCEKIVYFNNIFVGITSKNSIIISEDGLIWTVKKDNYSSDIIIFKNKIFISDTRSSSSKILYTNDINNWTSINISLTNAYKKFICNNNKIILFEEDTQKYIISEDGENWAEGDFPIKLTKFRNCSCYNKGKFMIMTGTNLIYNGNSTGTET